VIRPRRLAVLAGLLAGAWLAGFAWFVRTTGLAGPPPPHADGIVVFTGGADRVETALHLLAEGRADKMLISGVGGATEFRVLARRAGVSPALAPHVTLGRLAGSTYGNAAETAEWVRINHIASLIVVTAGYHMPRARAELVRALPGVAIHPVPVQPTAWRSGIGLGGLRLLAGEYTKFLAAEIGLSAIASRVGEHSAPHGESAAKTTEPAGG
jgi:uncharacterized SAM-binding protein YcdF (DUF218 family)